MIIEIAIGVALATAAAGGINAMLRRRSAPAAPPPEPRPSGRKAGARGLRCRDVVTAPGLEVALHAMIELDEEGVVLRAFRTLEVKERWLVQLDAEGKRLALGEPTAEVPGGSVPEALPIGGRMLRLERRGAAIARTEGPDWPAFARARYVVLSERAGRTVVVIDPEPGERIALRLEEIDIRGVDVLRGGDVPETK